MYELMIVDDETGTRDVLASCFPWEEEGFHVCSLQENGQGAYEYLRNHPVQVVLTDITMPVMGGVEFAKKIFVSELDPVIIFLSAHNDFKFAQEGMKYGVRYYLLKPASFAELKEVFETVRQELDRRFHVGKPENVQIEEDSLLVSLKKYCVLHFCDGSLSGFAEEQGLSPSYLSQLIRQKAGRNFSDFLIQARMEQAAVLLADPEQKIYHVSETVGYMNPNNFARAFKTYFGRTPSEYKENERE